MCLIQISGGLVELARAVVRYDSLLCSALLFPNVMHDTLLDFRKRYGAGRAIAAPQVGVMKRLIYMRLGDVSTVFINPVLEDRSTNMMEVWDDCLCFPDLLVRV